MKTKKLVLSICTCAFSFALIGGVMAGCSGSEESDSSSSEASSSESSASEASSSEASSSESSASESSSSESSASESSSSESSSSESSSSSSESTKIETGNEMQYVSASDVNEIIETEDSDYVIIDVREAKDYEEGHIPTAINADMDKAKDGEYDEAIEKMTEVIEDETGSSTGGSKDIILVGKEDGKHVQAGTDVLVSMGVDANHIFTLEGGMEAWEKDYPDDLDK